MRVAKSASMQSSKHHQAGASAPVHAQAPGSLYQRPIRPTQVEPSASDVNQSSSAAKLSKPKQQQQQPQQAAYRPAVHNVPPVRR